MKKHLCTVIATALAAALHAAVPIAWTATPASPPFAPPSVPHGSAVEFACTLKGFTTPPIAPGADVRLWYQTNGMGSAWFSAPATLSSNVVTASWGPAQDCGADRYALFFGAPSNVFASAVLRLTHAPGFVPTELSPPIQRLDFAAVEVANAPYYTKAETETKIGELSPPEPDFSTNNATLVKTIEAKAPTPGNYTVVSNAAMSAAAQTNSFLRLSGGTMTGGLSFYDFMDGISWKGTRYMLRPFGENRLSVYDGGDNILAYLHEVEGAATASTNYVDLATNGLFKVDRMDGIGTLLDWGYLYQLGITWEAYNVLWVLPGDPDDEACYIDEMTKLINLASTNYVDRKVASLAPSTPSAPETTASLRWRADGTACVVSVAANGTLSADTSNWTEGQAIMAIITLAPGAGVAANIELVGYGAWPTGTAFAACCYRVGLKIYVVPSTTL